MLRTLVLAGLLVDSWRDQSRLTEPSEMSLPGSATAIKRLRGVPDDAPSTPRLAGLVELDAMQWEPR